MAITWYIQIDWDRDGNFTSTYDDVTDRTISANWFLGMRQPYQTTADDSMITLVLDNSDKRFSPEYTSSPIYGKVVPFRKIRIQSNDGTTTRTHWLGWIESIEPEVDVNGTRKVKITGAGPMQFFKAAETHLELQEQLRTDEIIAELIREVVIPPGLLTGLWILGRVGNSELGSTTQFANTDNYSDLEVGTITLDMAGDNWVRQGGLSSETEDTFAVYRAIWDVTAAERGRFFFDREGKAIFWNRTHFDSITTDDASFNDTMQDVVYRYADRLDFKNEIVVMCHPRSISATSTETLWELSGSITVPAGERFTIQAKYQDDTGSRIGGRDVSTSNITFSSGSANVYLNAKANSAEVIIDNGSGGSPAVLSGLKIIGEKITDFGRMEITVKDATSIVEYGRRTLKLNLPAVDKAADAEAIADFELARRKDPQGTIRRLDLLTHGLDGGTYSDDQLSLTIGNRIGVTESQTDHDDSYFIIGEAHELTNGATSFKTSWYLEKVA